MNRIPFHIDTITQIRRIYPTPFYLYDENGIVDNAKRLIQTFSWAYQFRNYFAVKATPTPKIISLLQNLGMGFDCSSYAELEIAHRMGAEGNDIIFTSNNTPIQDMKQAYALDALINLDDISLINFLNDTCGMPEFLCVRYNPGPLKKGNAIIGVPEEAKYGFTREQIFEGYKKAQSMGVQRFGLHTMVSSNELEEQYFVETAVMLFDLAVAIKKKLGIRVEFVNLGGGIGIPYRVDQHAVNYETISEGIKTAYEKIIVPAGLDPLQIVMENGRVITGPYGYLVSTVLHKKNIYKQYVGIDATMANLMRPGIYGAYHHISVLGKENDPHTETYDVTGSLCENNDKFAIDRVLPPIEIDDIVVIHDAGAHGHSMGFNYNGKLRCAELILKTDGSIEMARRAETIDDYLETIIWE